MIITFFLFQFSSTKSYLNVFFSVIAICLVYPHFFDQLTPNLLKETTPINIYEHQQNITFPMYLVKIRK